MTTQTPAQDVSDAAMIEFPRIKLWFFRDLVDAQRKALFLLCGFSDAVTRGELDTHSAQLRALKHTLRVGAARELQQAQVVGDGVLATLDRVIDAVDKYPATTLVRQDWGDTLREVRAALTTPQSSAPVVGEAMREAWCDWYDEYLTDGNGHAPVKTGEACHAAFVAAYPGGLKAAREAALTAWNKLHPKPQHLIPPEPVSHPSVGWCDEYADWYEQHTAALGKGATPCKPD